MAAPKPVPTQPRRPHSLWLYEQAVQHPVAELALALKGWRHHHEAGDDDPWLLCEDFAGGAAVAAAWAASHPERQAMAVESDGRTVAWARMQTGRWLGERAADLHLVHADVMQMTSPRVDLVLALNYSTFIYQDRASLKRYFQNVRKRLQPGGLFMMDVFGGPGAMETGVRWRRVEPAEGQAFDVGWDQRRFDPMTHRIDCRLHFRFADGGVRPSAFRYDWRLWTVAEVRELLDEAGFGAVSIWCDRLDPSTGIGDGRYRPLRRLDARRDFVVQIFAQRKTPARRLSR